MTSDERYMNDKQIKHMVDRFLGWKLPENFSPDAGISFKPTFNDHLPTPTRYEPSGTNLFDATQAEAMVRYMIDGMPSSDRRHLDATSDEPLPCDVRLPPNTLIAKGCALSTLLTALNMRGGRFDLAAAGPDVPGENGCASPRDEESDERHTLAKWQAMDEGRKRAMSGLEGVSPAALEILIAYLPAAFWFRGTSEGFDFWHSIKRRWEGMLAAARKRGEEYDRETRAPATRGEANPLSSCGEKP
jgi:hypothetical protein